MTACTLTQHRYSTTGDLKGSSCKLEREDYREIHSVWSGFCFSGCLLLLVYSCFSSRPEYFKSSFRSITFFYGLPWKILQAAHGSAKWQEATKQHKDHVSMPLSSQVLHSYLAPQAPLKKVSLAGSQGTESMETKPTDSS